MPDPENLSELATFLHDYGGWAITVILLIAIFYLHRTTSALLERRNNELKALLAECKSVVAENKVFMTQVGDAMENSERVIKDNTEALIRVKALLEERRR